MLLLPTHPTHTQLRSAETGHVPGKYICAPRRAWPRACKHDAPTRGGPAVSYSRLPYSSPRKGPRPPALSPLPPAQGKPPRADAMPPANTAPPCTGTAPSDSPALQGGRGSAGGSGTHTPNAVLGPRGRTGAVTGVSAVSRRCCRQRWPSLCKMKLKLGLRPPCSRFNNCLLVYFNADPPTTPPSPPLPPRGGLDGEETWGGGTRHYPLPPARRQRPGPRVGEAGLGRVRPRDDTALRWCRTPEREAARLPAHGDNGSRPTRW